MHLERALQVGHAIIADRLVVQKLFVVVVQLVAGRKEKARKKKKWGHEQLTKQLHFHNLDHIERAVHKKLIKERGNHFTKLINRKGKSISTKLIIQKGDYLIVIHVEQRGKRLAVAEVRPVANLYIVQ
jgi:hypothetical protein